MKTLDQAKKLLGVLPGPDVPLALLPIQIQTRFVTRAGQAKLLVRVYPDDIHIDSHEPLLTAAEKEWGQRYWELIWPAAGDEEILRRAWEQLDQRFGARRSAWVARRLTPTNLAQRPAAGASTPAPIFPILSAEKDSAWTQPALAQLLPDRWVVFGYVGGTRVVLEVGAPILLPLAVSLDPSGPVPAVADDEALAIDEGTRWMVDFEEAERVGMGIRVVLPVGTAAPNLDQILVFGLNGTFNPKDAAGAVEAQLDAHHYTRGLALADLGTPTNNTPEASAGFSARDPRAETSRQVETQADLPAADSGSAQVARLFGLEPSVFTAVEGNDNREHIQARQMQTALWSITGEYYLEQILARAEGQPAAFSADEIADARRHFLDFVRPAGPLPTLRIGRQPYGLLPVMSLDQLAAAKTGNDRFVKSLLFLRGVWKTALSRTPHLRLDAASAEDDLVEILRMQPFSQGYQGRLVFDNQFFVPTGVAQKQLDPDLKTHAVLLRSRLRQFNAEAVVGDARVYNLLPAQTVRKLAAHLIQEGDEIPGAPLNPNYITYLRTASFDEIFNEQFPPDGPLQYAPDTFFFLVLRHAVLQTYLSTAYRILVRRGSLADRPILEPVLVDIIGTTKPSRTRTLLRILELDPALRASLHTLSAADEPEAAALDELRASLAGLETLAVDVLGRLLSTTLDLFAYRLDAWITSLATRRLDELRQNAARGLVIGAYGWLENLQPNPRTQVTSPPAGENGQPLFAAREKGGFIHAPSLDQAATAAVLRSGYLSQPGKDATRPFAIDLSSERVRLADWLLDGIRQGQSLGALLGYRFERTLHDQHLDRFIEGFRRVSLLAAIYLGQERLREAQSLPPGQARIQQIKAAQAEINTATDRLKNRFQFPAHADLGALERITAANRVDGLALVRQFETGSLPFDRLSSQAPTPGEQAQLELQLKALRASLDALSDALSAEGVYQAVSGNPVRAAASVDALAHGDMQPPELTFTQTNRAGPALSHRLATVFSGPPGAAPVGARMFRARAEPALNAWVRQMLGNLSKVRCLGQFFKPNGNPLGKPRILTLGALGISHLDAVGMVGEALPGQPSDLDRLLEFQFRRKAPASIPASAGFRLLKERSAGSFTAAQFSLEEFSTMAAAFRQAILRSRPLVGRDLIQSELPSPSGLDATEYQARADQAVQALVDALTALDAQRALVEAAAEDDLPAGLDTLRERILDLLFLGFANAVPLSPAGADFAARDLLLLQVRSLSLEAAQRLEQARPPKPGLTAPTRMPSARPSTTWIVSKRCLAKNLWLCRA